MGAADFPGFAVDGWEAAAHSREVGMDGYEQSLCAVLAAGGGSAGTENPVEVKT